jgi:hypothetical protein
MFSVQNVVREKPMNILKTFSVVKRGGHWPLLLGLLLAGSVVQSEATIYTVSSTANGITYSASYDNSLLNGFTSWAANGANQLSLQSLYYSVNGGPVALLTGAVVNTGTSGFNGAYINATYSIPNGSIADKLTINGSTVGESVQYNNLSSGAVSMKIFQYSDFVLGGAGYAGSQTVNMTPAPVSGGYATANQSGGGLAFAWNGDAPGFTTLVQANSSGLPFGPFIGSGTDLDNATLTAINTQAVFGYEFTGSVAQGSLLAVSETSAYPGPVPEPSSVALISSGMVALALMFRRGKSKNLDFHTRLC